MLLLLRQKWNLLVAKGILLIRNGVTKTVIWLGNTLQKIQLLQQLRNSKENFRIWMKVLWSFQEKVKAELIKASKKKREPCKAIVKYLSPTGRPLMLGQLNSMLQSYLIAQSQQGCVINTSIANATACALIQRFPQAVANIALESAAWARSLFKRMGFIKHWKTSSKFEIPEAARKEIEFYFLMRLLLT